MDGPHPVASYSFTTGELEAKAREMLLRRLQRYPFEVVMVKDDSGTHRLVFGGADVLLCDIIREIAMETGMVGVDICIPIELAVVESGHVSAYFAASEMGQSVETVEEARV